MRALWNAPSSGTPPAQQKTTSSLSMADHAAGEHVGEMVLYDLDAGNRSCKFRIALVGPRAFRRGCSTTYATCPASSR